MAKKKPEELRSHRWFGPNDLRSFGHRSRMLQMGFAREDFMGKPVIAVINTWSEINCCHTHLRDRANEVKRGVWQAGGIPIEMPAMTLAEAFERPTPMLHRNFLAMEVEQILRHHPFDGAVLLGGCDKTTPALLMGAASMNIPAVFVPAGPMLRGNWHGETLGSGSDSWKYWAELRAGTITQKDWQEIEEGIARSPGLCMTMGTGMTMTSLAEVLGMSLPGSSSIPAPDANHPRMASASGRRVVDMVWENLKPRDIMTAKAFENACVALMALGGSTNAFVHLVGMAGRCGVDLSLKSFDDASHKVPVILNLRPSGKYLAEDWYYAGGLKAALGVIRDSLHLDCLTVSGHTLGANIEGAKSSTTTSSGRWTTHLPRGRHRRALRQSRPRRRCHQAAAMDPRFLKHCGPALVYEDYNHMAAETDREDLDVTPDHVIVLQNGGPKGGPGMPEWGMLPIPKKLLKQGVRDMLRISDSRMSGTSYGACVLHVSPESYVGGPLALVRNGDVIEIDVAKRRLDLRLSEAEFAARRAAWTPPESQFPRGYTRMYQEHVTQADKGCDFDFLEFTGREDPEPEIH